MHGFALRINWLIYTLLEFLIDDGGEDQLLNWLVVLQIDGRFHQLVDSVGKSVLYTRMQCMQSMVQHFSYQ